MQRPTEEEYWKSGELDAELILSEARKRRAKLGHVIEYGCGDGRIARFIIPHTESFTCVDIAQTVLNLAKAQLTKFGLNANYELAGNMPTCDFLYSYQVLQHNPHDEQKRIMQRIYDSLKPGGLAMVHFAALETKPGYKNCSTCMCFTKRQVEELSSVFDRFKIADTDVGYSIDYFVWGRKKAEGVSE